VILFLAVDHLNAKERFSIKRLRLTSKDTAKLTAGIAQQNKAENIVILDMRKVVNFCDYFVICEGSSDRRIRAMANAISEGLDHSGVRVYHIQGLKEATWVLIDSGDVVIHLFETSTREFYGLEHLWQEAKQVT